MPGQVRRFIASIPVIVLLTLLSPARAQQKPAAPSRPSQAPLEDRVKQLETRLNAAEQKAASAAMEKDYITRVQKQYETYYEKAFNTQVAIVGILALFLTIVLAIAARFGFQTFDRRIDTALRETSAQLRTELETLRRQNSDQLKALEEGLTKRIIKQEKDLKTRSDYQFHYARALAAGVDGSYADARVWFRTALAIYKDTKFEQLIDKSSGASCARNIFVAIEQGDEANFEQQARKELEDELYNDLEDELARAALKLTRLKPLLQERKAGAAPPVAG